MSPFSSILVALDGSDAAARSLGCAFWLCGRLGARLHILSSAQEAGTPAEELARLQVPKQCRSAVVLHQTKARPEEAILAALARRRSGLFVISAKGAEGRSGAPSDPETQLGHVTRAVLERSSTPVLLLPPSYREDLPWERVLAPVSGESDDSLALALRLADALGLEVYAAHVADPESESLETETRYADAMHHEYPRRLEELLDRALSQGGSEARKSLKEVSLCQGDIASELLDLIERKQAHLLVVGWHGRFVAGSAQVLKKLIQKLEIPVLLVKPPARIPFRLKVGEEFD